MKLEIVATDEDSRATMVATIDEETFFKLIDFLDRDEPRIEKFDLAELEEGTWVSV